MSPRRIQQASLLALIRPLVLGGLAQHVQALGIRKEAGKIPIFSTYPPPRVSLDGLIRRIVANRQFTNNGPLLRQLEEEIGRILKLPPDKRVVMVSNGTVAIELALALAGVKTNDEIITTGFTYIATTSAILRAGAKPVFVDIDRKTLNIDPAEIEASITNKTKAILAVHTYGNPCDIEALEAIGKKHGIPIIYDGAHAFGTMYKNQPLLSHGDFATCSFHATKILHALEGGFVVCPQSKLKELYELRVPSELPGSTNAKVPEYNAGVALTQLKRLGEFFNRREYIAGLYNTGLQAALDNGLLEKPALTDGTTKYNNAYYPILFKSEETLLAVQRALLEAGISTRRYFYPTTDEQVAATDKPLHDSKSGVQLELGELLTQLSNASPERPIAKDVASRVLCLPMFHYGLYGFDVDRICAIILKALNLESNQAISAQLFRDLRYSLEDYRGLRLNDLAIRPLTLGVKLTDPLLLQMADARIKREKSKTAVLEARLSKVHKAALDSLRKQGWVILKASDLLPDLDPGISPDIEELGNALKSMQPNLDRLMTNAGDFARYPGFVKFFLEPKLIELVQAYIGVTGIGLDDVRGLINQKSSSSNAAVDTNLPHRDSDDRPGAILKMMYAPFGTAGQAFMERDSDGLFPLPSQSESGRSNPFPQIDGSEFSKEFPQGHAIQPIQLEAGELFIFDPARLLHRGTGVFPEQDVFRIIGSYHSGRPFMPWMAQRGVWSTKLRRDWLLEQGFALDSKEARMLLWQDNLPWVAQQFARVRYGGPIDYSIK
jgi:dTDP-4-amino-4,6-dideoxygalactose transaminase